MGRLSEGLGPTMIKEPQVLSVGSRVARKSVAPETLDAIEIARLSEVAAVATDSDNRVLACNEAAEELFECEQARVIGRDFVSVFEPKDTFGNPMRIESSTLVHLLQDGSPWRNFDCNLRRSCGQYQRATISMIVVLGPLPGQCHLVYMIWPVLRRRKADEVIARLLNGAGYAEKSGLGAHLRSDAGKAAILTTRQVEILKLVAAGRPTEEIAVELFISPATVRNHIRNILSRLGAHSRVEAVSAAYHRHLI